MALGRIGLFFIVLSDKNNICTQIPWIQCNSNQSCHCTETLGHIRLPSSEWIYLIRHTPNINANNWNIKDINLHINNFIQLQTLFDQFFDCALFKDILMRTVRELSESFSKVRQMANSYSSNVFLVSHAKNKFIIVSCANRRVIEDVGPSVYIKSVYIKSQNWDSSFKIIFYL